MEHPIGNLMDTTMNKIKEMVDVNTIVGEPITAPDGTLIIPVSKVTYGFAAGGSDLPTKKENKDCFGGGSGAGVTIPVSYTHLRAPAVPAGEAYTVRSLPHRSRDLLQTHKWVWYCPRRTSIHPHRPPADQNVLCR